ncbi:MAG TPA: helix-turn-helix domain-containing protein, partial [Thermoleophilaceae bacterium]|nr:helix-turn-helix domain-containing protein [Thermoleophilaceae bacterium]
AGPTSVQAVAAAVGYRQPAQFAKAFRRHYGCTPTLFREGHGPRSRAHPSGTGSADANGGNGNGAVHLRAGSTGALLAAQPVARSVT